MLKKLLISFVVVLIIASAIVFATNDINSQNSSNSSQSEVSQNATSTSSSQVQSEQTTSSSENSQATSEIVIVDAADRKVVLESEAQTIVSSYYITTYATIALGVEDRVIGLEKKAESRPIYALAAPELLEVTQVGSLKEFNIEAVAELNPDIVLMPIRLLEQANTLENLGIKTLIVDPETQKGLEEMLQIVAMATGSSAKADELLLAYEEIFAKTDLLTTEQEKPIVYMGSNSSFLESATSQMYQNFLIEKASGINAFASLNDDYWAAVSYEAILEKNPDYIIIPSAASYSVEDIMNDAQLKDISAVINGDVYMMPAEYEEWDSPVPSGVLGVYWLASILHGGETANEDFENTKNEFYQKFYGFEPN